MQTKNNHKYLLVDNDKLKLNLNTLIDQLKNVYEDNGHKYFFGGGRIPLVDGLGSELECAENVDTLKLFLPIMKNCIKGHSNWCQMSRSEKLVANHLKFFCNVLCDGKSLTSKAMRYPKFKSYMVKKYIIPESIYT